MPAIVKKVGKKGKVIKGKEITPKEADRRWKKAEKIAAEEGQGGNYAYITGIFKKMVKEELEVMYIDPTDV